MAPSVRAVLRRLRRAAVPVVVAAALAVVGVVFRDRIVDWFAGRGGVGDWSTPVRGKAGALAVDLSLVPNPPRQNGNHVRVELSDAAGEPTDAEVKVTYDMAAMGAMPEMKGVVTVRRRAKGRFEGGFDLPIGGGWGLIVDVTTGSKTSTARYSFTVGAPGVLALDGDDSEPAGDSMAGMPGMGSGDSMAGTPGMGGGAATPTAAPSYPPAALTALRGGLDAYARVSSGLAAGLVDQESAGRLALALRDAGKALGHASDNTSAALDASARAADAIAATSDVATARKAFADLNRAVVAVMAADPRVAGDWKLFECPMAPNYKRWFQREPAPTNPYLGREMSKCVSEVPWTAAVPTATAAGDTGEIKIDAERRQVIGLRTDKVVKAPMTLDIRAVGRVTYDETRLTDVTLRVGGFITDLRVAATGRAVKKGETLFTLYSPELYAAQQEYLIALRSRGSGSTGLATASDALLRASEKKLRLWGLSSAQIGALAASGEVSENVAIPSPASGYVIEKNVVEGAAVEMGMRLFRIVALDTIWIEADLYEPDLRQVRPGTTASVSLDYTPGEAREGKVTFVYPYLDPMTRTGRVRIELPNRGLALKPDMYATVELKVALGERVQVPTAAILVTGTRRIVFVDVGRGRLRPQLVKTGAHNAELTEVLDGLAPGDVVVTSGNFLVASESRLRSSAALWRDEP